MNKIAVREICGTQLNTVTHGWALRGSRRLQESISINKLTFNGRTHNAAVGVVCIHPWPQPYGRATRDPIRFGRIGQVHP